MYNEEAFRYLLSSESKRSVRSGYSFNILLIYSIDKQGLIVQMDREVVETVAEALFRTVRETDYIGWYQEGRIIGGVLTVLGQDSEAEVSARIQQRLMEIFRAEVSVEKNGRLQIRICQHHELEGIEYRKGNFTVN
jgi:PleD family two-component response regulator